MRIDVTRQPSGAIFLQLLVVLGLAWYGHTLHPLEFEASLMSRPLGGWINRIGANMPYLNSALSALLAMGSAFIITRTISRNLIFPSRTYLSAIFYFITCYAIYYTGQNLAAMLAAYLLVLSSSYFILSFTRSDTFGSSFTASVLLGITPLLHPSAIVFIVLTPLAMTLFRRGARETIVAIIGSLLPLLICAYAMWAMGGEFSGLFVDLWRQLTLHSGLSVTIAGLGLPRVIVATMLAITLLLSIAIFLFTTHPTRTRPLKTQIFMICFLALTIIPLLLPSRSVGDLAIIAIPLSFIAPILFVRHRGVTSAIIYVMLIAAVLVKLLLVNFDFV